MSTEQFPHQADPARRRRLRWRSRRGLLENDLLLTRFLDGHEASLSDDDVAGLDELLDLSDNELLDYILERKQPGTGEFSPKAMNVLVLLRKA